MKYAENNRISHRQLYRQIVLALTAPFLLCAAGWQDLEGADGVMAILLALPLISLYVIFLIRFSYVYENPERYLGKFLWLCMGLFFLSYVVLTGAYLLSVLGEIVPKYLVAGVDGRLLQILAATVCGLGTCQGMQRRGRMAEVTGGFVVGGLVLLYLLSVSQGDIHYFPQLFAAEIPLDGRRVCLGIYEVICIFAGIGLLPLTLSGVEKPSGAARPVLKAIGTVGLLLGTSLILLQGAFGGVRVLKEGYPVVPLMAGANFPGNILGRFDVIWMGILLFSLLFAIGSLQYYGTYILQSMHLDVLRWSVPVLMVFFAWIWFSEMTVLESYPWILSCIFTPGFLIAAAVVGLGRRRKGSMGDSKREEKVQ